MPLHYTTRRLLSITAIVALLLGVFGPKLFSTDFAVAFEAARPFIANPLLWLFNRETYPLVTSTVEMVFLGEAVGLLLSIAIHVGLVVLLVVTVLTIWDLGSDPKRPQSARTQRRGTRSDHR